MHQTGTAYQGSTVKSDITESQTVTDGRFPKVTYVRTGYYELSEKPNVIYIRSKKELNEYFNSNKVNYSFEQGWDDKASFGEVISQYDDKFFESKALVLVVTVESSGSHYYSNTAVDKNSILIQRNIPPVCTCDMAFWHTIIEFDKDNEIFNLNPDSVRVYIYQEESKSACDN